MNILFQNIYPPPFSPPNNTPVYFKPIPITPSNSSDNSIFSKPKKRKIKKRDPISLHINDLNYINTFGFSNVPNSSYSLIKFCSGSYMDVYSVKNTALLVKFLQERHSIKRSTKSIKSLFAQIIISKDKLICAGYKVNPILNESTIEEDQYILTPKLTPLSSALGMDRLQGKKVFDLLLSYWKKHLDEVPFMPDISLENFAYDQKGGLTAIDFREEVLDFEEINAEFKRCLFSFKMNFTTTKKFIKKAIALLNTDDLTIIYMPKDYEIQKAISLPTCTLSFKNHRLSSPPPTPSKGKRNGSSFLKKRKRNKKKALEYNESSKRRKVDALSKKNHKDSYLKENIPPTELPPLLPSQTIFRSLFK